MINSENLKYWDQFADIDPKYTKPITGKPYKGTSPNPQYVMKCLTEMFGPVGEGFGWSVLDQGFQPLGDEILHWCRIEFWHTDRANTFESYGQTKALMKTRNGMLSDEDAPKKSLTDAVTKAASHVGIAANIFLGRWDDQKYVNDLKGQFDDDSKAPNSDQEKTPTTQEKVNAAKTLEDINNLVPEVAKLENASATRHLHERAVHLGFVGNRETKKYELKAAA